MWHTYLGILMFAAATLSYGMAGYYWGAAETKNGAYRDVAIPGLITTARIFGWLMFILFAVGGLLVLQ